MALWCVCVCVGGGGGGGEGGECAQQAQNANKPLGNDPSVQMSLVSVSRLGKDQMW